MQFTRFGQFSKTIAVQFITIVLKVETNVYILKETREGRMHLD